MATKVLKEGTVRLSLVQDECYRMILTGPDGEAQTFGEFTDQAEAEALYEVILTGLGAYARNQLRGPFYAFRDTLERLEKVLAK